MLFFTPDIPCCAFWISIWNISGKGERSKSILVKHLIPRWVEKVVRLLGVRGIWRNPCRRSSLEKWQAPFSRRCNRCLFRISMQHRISLRFLGFGTHVKGDTQGVWPARSSMFPASSSFCSYFSTCLQTLKGMKQWGWTIGGLFLNINKTPPHNIYMYIDIETDPYSMLFILRKSRLV